MSERRAFPRWAAAVECQAATGDRKLPVLIHDVSENGLRLACSRSADPGEEFDIWWRLGTNEEPVELHCVVRDSNDSKLGVEFLRLSRANRLRILHFICDKQLTRADVNISSGSRKA